VLNGVRSKVKKKNNFNEIFVSLWKTKFLKTCGLTCHLSTVTFVSSFHVNFILRYGSQNIECLMYLAGRGFKKNDYTGYFTSDNEPGGIENVTHNISGGKAGYLSPPCPGLQLGRS
jgi:hypothetical protein